MVLRPIGGAEGQVEGRANRGGPIGRVEDRVADPDRSQRGLLLHGGAFDIDHFLADPETYKAIHEIVREGPSAGEFRMKGPVWTLILDHDQTTKLSQVLIEGGGPLLAAAGVAAPVIAGALFASIVYINFVDRLGGNNGVEINGVVGVQGILVHPRLMGGRFELLADSARIGVAGVTITAWLVAAIAKSPALATALQFAPLAAIANAVSLGTPLGLAIGAALDLALEGEPNPDTFGPVVANRNHVGEWESFEIGTCRDSSEVSLMSHMGHFSAVDGGGKGVYANRPDVGAWERWGLIKHGDGTTSFLTANAHLLTAELGGGRECNANRTSIGPWEKFHIEPLAGGKFALRTFVAGHYVCVEPR